MADMVSKLKEEFHHKINMLNYKNEDTPEILNIVEKAVEIIFYTEIRINEKIKDLERLIGN